MREALEKLGAHTLAGLEQLAFNEFVPWCDPVTVRRKAFFVARGGLASLLAWA